MKIAFWSPIHGQAGTTSNILITALMTGLVFRKRTLLTQTHFNFNNLEAPLVDYNPKNNASADYYLDVGLDSLIRSFKAARLDKASLENCCIAFPDTNVTLLPGTTKSNKDSFEAEMGAVIINLLRSIEELYSVVFIDVSPGDNPLSLKIIEDSELVVVNLSQNIAITQIYFNLYGDRLKSRAFYLFGDYDRNSKYNLGNLRRRFSKDITVLNSGVIPYNTAFHDSQCDTRTIDFLQKNLNCSKDDENYYFIMKSLKAVTKLLKCAGMDIRSEEGCNKQ